MGRDGSLLRWCIFPQGLGEGRVAVPKQLVPICSAQKGTLTRRGRKRASELRQLIPWWWGLGLGWEQGCELQPLGCCRVALKISLLPSATPERRSIEERCSQPARWPDILGCAWSGRWWWKQGAQQWGLCAGGSTAPCARSPVGIPRNCWEEREGIVLQKQTNKSKTQQKYPNCIQLSYSFVRLSILSVPDHSRWEIGLWLLSCSAFWYIQVDWRFPEKKISTENNSLYKSKYSTAQNAFLLNFQCQKLP